MDESGVGKTWRNGNGLILLYISHSNNMSGNPQFWQGICLENQNLSAQNNRIALFFIGFMDMIFVIVLPHVPSILPPTGY